jgi:hypothetical protein
LGLVNQKKGFAAGGVDARFLPQFIQFYRNTDWYLLPAGKKSDVTDQNNDETQ